MKINKKLHITKKGIVKRNSGDSIYVGGLGYARRSKEFGWINTYYVLEEDGTKSWQLHPNEYSDKVLKVVKVYPLESSVIADVLENPTNFGLSPEEKQGKKIYEKLSKIMKRRT